MHPLVTETELHFSVAVHIPPTLNCHLSHAEFTCFISNNSGCCCERCPRWQVAHRYLWTTNGSDRGTEKMSHLFVEQKLNLDFVHVLFSLACSCQFMADPCIFVLC